MPMSEEEYLEAAKNSLPPEVIPVILHEGKYRLYEKPDGTLRVQYQRNDKDTEDFMEIPGMMIRLAKAASEGQMSPMAMMKSAMGYLQNGGTGVSSS